MPRNASNPSQYVARSNSNQQNQKRNREIIVMMASLASPSLLLSSLTKSRTGRGSLVVLSYSRCASRSFRLGAKCNTGSSVTNRRVFFGIGALFADQLVRMASGSGGVGRSFVASARPRQDVSPVEQVFNS
jgi:hypothetical protein